MSRASGRPRCGRCPRGWVCARCPSTGTCRTATSCSTRWWRGSSTSSLTTRRFSPIRWTGGVPISPAWATGSAATPWAHPHAFPLVATRPPSAPWVNPPLRSLRWVETMLAGLAKEGFSDDQVLFTYRTFNGFLLGYLLLETSAMTLRDPKPGDGFFAAADTAASESGPGRAAAADPVPGGLSPARSAGQREAVEAAGSPPELIDPADQIDARRFPTVYRLAGGWPRTSGNRSSNQAWPRCLTALPPTLPREQAPAPPELWPPGSRAGCGPDRHPVRTRVRSRAGSPALDNGTL